ncbi:S41 family peptidase [Pedobacter sp.]|uniref:S41 family peptidase n=1 Tax=Pedobacter sp. TaxID=1411316 RepID=UPI00396C4232
MILIVALISLSQPIIYAQFNRDSTGLTVNQVSESLIQRYIDPDVGHRMAEILNANLKLGKYDRIASGQELANQLTLDVRSIFDDRHLVIYYSAKELEKLNGFATQLTEQQQLERFETMKKEQFGLKKVAILEGNIGYLDFKYFGPLDYSGELIVKAMDTLSSTNALIIDLRSCTGSMSEDFNLLFPGYFLSRSVLLSTTSYRLPKQAKQNWSYGYVPGKKYLNKPVYILTSGGTFSGAEALAYCLQALKRITIVGDVTGGAANPVGSITLNNHFGINMPEASVTNAITKTNWETVGVIPELKVPARDALRIAHLVALDTIMKTKPEKWKPEYSLIVEKLKADKPLTKLVQFSLEGYQDAKSVSVAGDFNYWGRHTNQLERNNKGGWSIRIEVPKGKIRYRFMVDNQKVLDPLNPEKEDNVNVKIVKE